MSLDADLQKANRAFASGNVELALACAEAAAAEHPYSVAAYDFLGLARMSKGDAIGSVEAIQRSIRLGETADSQSNLSVALLALGDIDGAIAAGRRAVDLDAQWENAYHNLARALEAAGRSGEALDVLIRLSQVAPRSELAAINLGRTLTGLGRAGEAVAALKRYLRQSPDSLDVRYLLALAQLNAGWTVEARDGLLAVASKTAPTAELLYNLGQAHKALKSYRPALEALRKAVTLNPNWSAARLALGEAARECGELGEAISVMIAACGADPGNAELYIGLGAAFRAASRMEEAGNAFARAAELAPRSVSALRNFAVYLRDFNHLHKALDLYQRALAIEPNNADILCDAGIVHQMLLQDGQAEKLYRRSLELAPGGRTALLGVAALANDAGDYDAAEGFLEQILARWPNSHEALCGMGIISYRRGSFELADSYFQKTISLAPDWRYARFVSSFSLLKQGDYERGWPAYEDRLGEYDHVLRHWTPRGRVWKGEDLKGRTLLLRREQGLGDQLQCARYIPLLINMGVEVWVHSWPTLSRMMQRLGARLIDNPEAGEAPDFELPFFSLPYRFSTRIDGPCAPPLADGYLGADPDRAQMWRARLPQGKRIGLFWQGSLGTRVDRGRSLTLKGMLEAIGEVDASLISLQKGAGLEQLQDPALGARVLDPAVLAPELNYTGGDMLETAALIDGLDLVVTCDTAVGHLAGAMGKPVFILIAKANDWRWLNDRSDSIWYTSVRLFRQREFNDWSPPLAEMGQAVADFCRR